MLVGKSQALELHPMDAGYAFFAKRSFSTPMKKAPKNFYAIGKFIIAMLLQHYSADAILK